MRPIFRVRGYCVHEWQGGVLMVGGIQHQGEHVVAFMDMKPEAKRFPRAIWECSLAVIAMARATGVPVYAVQDTGIESSERYLRRLGFVPLGIEDMWRLA